MKFLNWMQSKLNGKQGSKQPVAVSKNPNNVVKQETRKDEFSDWPHGLLTIGTFGNNNDLKDQQDSSSASSSSRKNYSTNHNYHNQIEEEEEEEGEIHLSSSPEVDVDQLDFTPEEVGRLQEVLKKLLSRKPKPIVDTTTSDEQCRTGSGRRGGNGSIMNLPLDKFLNCPSSLEVDRKINNDSVSNDNNNEYRTSDLRRSLSLIANMAKNLSPERTTKAIKKKSISFLLKKVFVCRSGFPTPAPAPSFRDSIPESRIEKLLRAIINKNMYTRSASPAASAAKKYLENGHSYIMNKADDEDHYREEEEEENQEQQPKEKVATEGCKWDKTDNDYIVLEI